MFELIQFEANIFFNFFFDRGHIEARRSIDNSFDN